MPRLREEIVEKFLSNCTEDVAEVLDDVAERSCYPGCGTIEAVHMLVALRRCDVDFFDVSRTTSGEGFDAFRPAHTALVNAIRQVMPAKKDGRSGEMEYGRTALAVLQSAQELAGSDNVHLSHLFLALLLRQDIQAVLSKAGYTVQELRTLKEEMVELCIEVSGAIHPRAKLWELRTKALYVLQDITPEQMATLRCSGVEAKFFSEKGCPVEGVAVDADRLQDACSVLGMNPFARQRVFFTEHEEVFHAVLRPRNGHRSTDHTVCYVDGIEDIVCTGDGWDADAEFGQSIEWQFNEHVAPRVEATVYINETSDFLEGDHSHEDEIFRVGLCIWHKDMRRARGKLAPNRETDRFVRVTLSTEEVQRATKYVLGQDEPAFVYADIYARAMTVRMHCALFKDHGARTILLDSLLRKCAPHLRPDMRSQDLVDSIPTDDLPADPENNLTFVGFYDQNKRKKQLRALLHGVFMRGLKENMEVRESAAPRSEVVEADGQFHVFYPSIGTGRGNYPQYPLGRDIPILDEAGSIVGELGKRSLRIYKDFLAEGAFNELKELAKLLQTARTLRLMSGRSRKAKQLVAQKFITECLFALKVGKPDRKKKTVASRLERAGEELTAQIERSRDVERRLTEINLTGEAEFGPEFDSLMELEKIKSVEVTEDQLVVHTDTILCIDDRTGRVHELGEFRITIHFSHGGVAFTNVTRQVTNGNGEWFYAPHVNVSRACLGNIQDLLPDLVRQRHFVPAVQLCLAFLETANTNDPWGKNVDQFPVARYR